MELKSYAAETHQGPYLEVNEDDYEVDLSLDCYMVFDGFGGSGVGDKCVGQLKNNIKHFYSQVSGDPDATLPFAFSHKYLLEGNALINSFHYSHQILCKENSQKPMSQRAGASAIVAVAAENLITIASVGNCVGYLYRKGDFQKLNAEDNLNLLGGGTHEAELRTLPLSGFGLFEDIHIDVREVRILAGDQIIFMTDGIYGRVKLSEIKYILDQSGISPTEKIKNLFKEANNHGNMDNQTALILQY